MLGMARAEEIAAAAIQEDVDLVGLNVGGRIEGCRTHRRRHQTGRPRHADLRGRTLSPLAVRRLDELGIPASAGIFTTIYCRIRPQARRWRRGSLMPITDLFRLDVRWQSLPVLPPGWESHSLPRSPKPVAAGAISGRRVGNLELTEAEIAARGGEALVVSADSGTRRSATRWSPRRLSGLGRSASSSTTPVSAPEAPPFTNRPGSSGVSSTSISMAVSGWRRPLARQRRAWRRNRQQRQRSRPDDGRAAACRLLCQQGRDHGTDQGSGRPVVAAPWHPGELPGSSFFPSEMTEQYPEGYLDRMERDRVLMGRLGEADELAATLVWLVSPRPGYVTGQTIVVDGGVVNQPDLVTVSPSRRLLVTRPRRAQPAGTVADPRTGSVHAGHAWSGVRGRDRLCGSGQLRHQPPGRCGSSATCCSGWCWGPT